MTTILATRNGRASTKLPSCAKDKLSHQKHTLYHKEVNNSKHSKIVTFTFQENEVGGIQKALNMLSRDQQEENYEVQMKFFN